MVVEQNDVKLQVLLHRGDDFLRHHQIGTIPHKHVHFAMRMSHFHPQSPGDFITHTGVAILHVIAAGLMGAPEFVQVSGQTAGGAD